MNDIVMNIHKIRDECRANLNKYTREAFESIPAIKQPHILDLGCGTGVPTLEIAGLSDGKIVAVDIDQASLDVLRKKIEILNLKDRISIVQSSVFEADLPENHYDIIVAEGILHITGFERGLRTFSRLLKDNGYFLIHDEFRDEKKKLKVIAKYRFELVKFFIMDEEIWREEYYGYMEKKIMDMEKMDSDHSIPEELIKPLKDEIAMFKKDPSGSKSIYYVLKKSG
jgi:ubiquinone/menaquinone biosynthesis C-methylase UbiE